MHHLLRFQAPALQIKYSAVDVLRCNETSPQATNEQARESAKVMETKKQPGDDGSQVTVGPR